jgi:hypothetical protein
VPKLAHHYPFFGLVDSKIIYLTECNHCMRARSGRPKDDVGMTVNLWSWLELRVTDDIHELGLDIMCGRYGLETEGCISLCNINGVVWSGYSLIVSCLFVVSVCSVDSSG